MQTSPSKPDAPRNTLIILGMHRSGTSLITQWLNKCGLHVGDRLMGAGVGNLDGHYEDLDFYEWHEAVLQNNGFPSSGFINAGSVLVSLPEQDALNKIIARKCETGRDWGWKDPRTCLFLPAYANALPNAKHLFIVRNYREVVTSLLRRDLSVREQRWLKGHSGTLSSWYWTYFKKNRVHQQHIQRMAESYLKVYIHYNTQLLHHLEVLNTAHYQVLDYRKLVKNDRVTFQVLKSEWDFNLTYVPFASVYKGELIQKATWDLSNWLPAELEEQAIELEKRILSFAQQ